MMPKDRSGCGLKINCFALCTWPRCCTDWSFCDMIKKSLRTTKKSSLGKRVLSVCVHSVALHQH